ncbi:MAG: linear amide C-N hydrolase [Spirochaetia bacterium]|nr:linear amide C-N hydrolase [Spirochaetia bacterium]
MVIPEPILPCSTMSYSFKENTYLARNYDFPFGHGMLVTNKRNMRKAGLISHTEHMHLAAEWKSKYGSITFNQFSRELPTGGINEKGLAVELMWLIGSRPGKPDSRKAVNELQWIQYQLDHYKSVREMKINAEKIQIISTAAPLHYIACDASGECGIFDFHENQVTVYTGKTLEEKISTNHFYKDKNISDKEIDISTHYKNEEKIALRDSSRRFQLLSQFLKNPVQENPVEYGFSGIDAVKGKMSIFRRMIYLIKGQNPATHWQIVYSLQKKEIFFRTHSSKKIKKVSLDHFDYSCRTPVHILDIDHKAAGNANDAFKTYERSDNERIVNLSFRKWDQLPKNGQKFLVDLPEKFSCED